MHPDFREEELIVILDMEADPQLPPTLLFLLL